MKTPRINDFDPNAPRSLASPLDGMPEILPAARLVAAAAPDESAIEPEQSDGQSSEQPMERSIDQSTERSIEYNVSTKTSRVLEKPKGFYITEGLDRRIDQAVRYLKETHGIKKVDRSVVVTVMLEKDDYWTEQSLDQLVEPVIRQLTSRLMGK